MCAAWTSPSMRASEDTTRVPGWSGSAATLPRTMPSTRSPPLKITLPSMRVVAPIRLSMRFRGLLVLLNTFVLSFPSLQTHRVRGARLAVPGLVDPRLHALDLGLRVHPERPFDAPEVLEGQPERRRCGIPRLGKGHHSTLTPLLQVDGQLEAPVEVPSPTIGRGKQEQAITIFARQHVGLDLEAVDRQRLRVTFFRNQHLLDHGEFLAHARQILLQPAHLLPELLLRSALDRHAAVGGIGDRAQALELGARRGELAARGLQLGHHFAAIETGEAPAGVVDPGSGGAGDTEQDRDARPAPVPRDLRLHFDARRGDPEPLADHFPAAGGHQGTTATCSRPVVSGQPNIRFMFCTAWPEAPLTRLSITESTTKVSERLALSGGRCTARRQVFAARTERVSGWLPWGITSTNGSPA